MLRPMATTETLLGHCRGTLSPGEMERLVGWLAWRTGRNQALAGDGPPEERLERAVERWLGPTERALLLAWMLRRQARGLPPVPD